MGRLDTRYIIKLDTKATFLNPTLVFSINDAETSDLYIRVTNKHKLIDVSNMIPVIVVIDPHGQLYSDFMEVTDDNLLYYDIKKTMKSQSGKYIAKVMLVDNQEKKVLRGNFSYAVEDDEISLLDEKAGEDDRLPILTEFISRLSTIEKLELSRQEAETNRVEAEKQREIAKQQLIDQVNKLIADTSLKVEENLSEQNKKVDDNLLENSNKVTKLISDTTTKIDSYKTEKDEAIQQDLQLYKQETTKNIDDYKLSKDIEINKNLSDYKTSTTTDIETYKNNKNAEINQYKTEKDLEIDTYVANKNKELDRYVAAKNNDIDNYKKAKDLLIDDKLKEVDASEKSRAEAETLRQEQHTEREAFLNGFESKVNANEAKNTEQDGRLNSVEYISKRQDVVLGGLLNESGDKRLAIEGEGNYLKLEHSKDGVVEVNSVVGNTMVNLWNKNNLYTSGLNGLTILNDRIRITTDGSPYYNFWLRDFSMFKPSTQYTIIVTIYKTTAQPGDIIIVTSNSVGNNDAFNAYTELPANKVGVTKLLKVTTENYSDVNLAMRSYFNNKSQTVGSEVELSFIVLEGDYTNKPIPNEYFEGMKSTFEDCLVTQEMIDAGTEKAENLGKYKAELKVVGKNLINESSKVALYIGGADGITIADVDPNTLSYVIPCKPNTVYRAMYTSGGDRNVLASFSSYPKNQDKALNKSATYRPEDISTITTDSNARYLMFYCCSTTNIPPIEPIIVESSNPITPYEPYKESKQTLYLDEPLYKDNELCIHNGQLGYWKNRDKYTFTGKESIDTYVTDTHVKYGVFNSNTNMIKGKMGGQLICDRYSVVGQVYNDTVAEGIGSHGAYVVRFNILKTKFNNPSDSTEFKQGLQQNPTSIIYELAEPIFVPILENTPQWILDCFNDCTLSIDSNIPATSMSAVYTGNVVSVVALEKIQYEQDKVAIENAYKLSVLGIMTGVTI